MHETAAERERRLRQLDVTAESLWYGNLGGAEWWGGSELVINQNPCVEIPISYGNELTLGVDPLVKFTKYIFKF
jgi:hypothetical protein